MINNKMDNVETPAEAIEWLKDVKGWQIVPTTSGYYFVTLTDGDIYRVCGTALVSNVKQWQWTYYAELLERRLGLDSAQKAEAWEMCNDTN